MITFQTEQWRPFFVDAEPIMVQHWNEIALDKNKIKLSLNQERYHSMDAQGILHTITIRKYEKLIGYFIAFVIPHIHYQEAGLMAFTDIYYLLPEHRKGSLGIQLFREVEKSLRAKGVTKMYLSTKVHKDNSSIFEKLGWTLTDKVYTKVFD